MVFALAAAGCVGLYTGGIAPPQSASADYKVTAGRPPSAADRVARVPAGGSVEIELSGRGSPRQSLLFLLRNAPVQGTLGELRSTGRDTAVVTYRHRGGPSAGPGSDSFTYAVRAEGSVVSAAATVRVEIVAGSPRVVVIRHSDRGRESDAADGESEPLDFGAVLVGQEARRELTLENAGGGVATGTLEPPAPWQVEAAGVAAGAMHSYRLARGERQRVTLVFRPGVARSFDGAMKLSGSAAVTTISDEPVVRLVGTGLPEPATAPAPPAAVEVRLTPAVPSPTVAVSPVAAATPSAAPPEPAPANAVTALPRPRSTPVPVAEPPVSSHPASIGARSPILGLELLGADKKSLTVGWTFPNIPPRVSGPWPVRYRAELQQVRREPAGGTGSDIGVDWVPHENATWSSQGGGETGGAQTWRGTLHGLRAGTTQIVRVVGLDENGNAFPPSPFLIAATQPPARPLGWLTWPKMLLAALVVCAGLLWRQRREAMSAATSFCT